MSRLEKETWTVLSSCAMVVFLITALAYFGVGNIKAMFIPIVVSQTYLIIRYACVKKWG